MEREKAKQIAEALEGLTWEEWAYIKESVNDTFGKVLLPSKDSLNFAILKGPINRRYYDSRTGYEDSSIFPKKEE